MYSPNSFHPDASEGESGWWLHMSMDRQAREKELFHKLVTHFYLVRIFYAIQF